MKIGNRTIGKKPFILAEAGINHEGKIELAYKLIDAAKNAGADGVKFSTYKTEEIVTREADMAKYQKDNTGTDDSQFNALKKVELSYDDFRELKKYADKEGILFLSTPHTTDSVDFLDDLVPAFKVGSGDLTNLAVLKKIAQKGKPIILSTGMADMDEIQAAVNTIKEHNQELILLHCTTSYPCPNEDANLKAIDTLRNFGFPVGFSDHTLGIDIPAYAVNVMDAVFLEKHLTLDNDMPGLDHKASLNPENFKLMVEAIRDDKKPQIDKACLGTGVKEPTKTEIEIAKIARKSIVAQEDIPKGTVITEDMLAIKRPGDGIQPSELSKVVGMVAQKDIVADTLLSFNDLKP